MKKCPKCKKIIRLHRSYSEEEAEIVYCPYCGVRIKEPLY